MKRWIKNINPNIWEVFIYFTLGDMSKLFITDGCDLVYASLRLGHDKDSTTFNSKYTFLTAEVYEILVRVI